MKHIATFFVWLERCCCCRHSGCTCLVLRRRTGALHIHDHAPNVSFDRKHGIQFSLSVLSVVVDDPPVTNVMDEQGICLALAFTFTFSLLFSEGMVSLYIGLYQLCTHFRVNTIVPRASEKCNCIQFSGLHNSDIVQGNIRRKCVIFLIIVIVQSFFSVTASGVNKVVVCLTGVCGLNRVVHVFIIIIVIFNGRAARVTGTCSRFSVASVFSFAFSAKLTSVWIVNTFKSVFAFSL